MCDLYNIIIYTILDVSSDPDQVLYGSCKSSDVGSTQCGQTVLDFLLNQPLCSKHVNKTVCLLYHSNRFLTYIETLYRLLRVLHNNRRERQQLLIDSLRLKQKARKTRNQRHNQLLRSLD